MKQLIYAKSSGDGGGICHMAPSTGRRRNRYLEMVAESHLVITMDRENNLEVVKNRYGETGHFEVSDAVELFSEIISRMIFQERMLLFQESVKERLIERINKTIELGGGEFIDTIQRACGTDGS